MPQIEVTFDIDANGIVNVSAKDLGTGKEQKITITASSGLDKDAVEQMVNDAESPRRRGSKAREAADARNKADQMVYQVEKTLKENERQAGRRDNRSRGRGGPQGRSEALEDGDRRPDQDRDRTTGEGLAQAGRGDLP